MTVSPSNIPEKMYNFVTIFAIWGAFGVFVFATLSVNREISYCPPLGPVLPPPKTPSSNPKVQATVSQIKSTLSNLTGQLPGTALSIGVASVYEDKPLLSYSYTPKQYNKTGTHHVDTDTVFRIGSVSKAFTTLGLLQLGEKINMADPITKYIPELSQFRSEEPVNNAVTTVDWQQVTLDALASQLSGIGNSFGDDLANEHINLVKYGLPKLNRSEHTECGGLPNQRPCTLKDFFASFGQRHPVNAPYQTPIYSNVAYDLLGLVIERISKQSFEEYVQDNIFKPLGLSRTSISKPSDDKIGFISSEPNFWSTSYGFDTADGGFYSSVNDLITWGTGILNYTLLSPAATRAWLKPRTHTSSLGLSVGAPWEIARSDKLTSDRRLVDVYSKNGGLTDYNALFAMIPDYNIVLALLMAGPESSLNIQIGIVSQVLESLIPTIEEAGKDDAKAQFAGAYTDEASNSSITLSIDDGPGLKVAKWIARRHDVLSDYPSIIAASPLASGSSDSGSNYLSVRLYPTELQTDKQFAWRALYSETSPKAAAHEDSQLFFFEGSCQTWSLIDNPIYGLRALDDFVFEMDNAGVKATAITPRAFRQTLARV